MKQVANVPTKTTKSPKGLVGEQNFKLVEGNGSNVAAVLVTNTDLEEVGLYNA